MSEFPSQPENTPGDRVSQMQELLVAMQDSDFTDVEQMQEFMDLYDIHVRGLLTDNAAFVRFLESLDQPGLRFTEAFFDSIVYRHDDLAPVVISSPGTL